MHWALLVILGASLNVVVNYGFKVAGGPGEVAWLAAGSTGVAGLTLILFAVLTRQPDSRRLREGRTPVLIVLMGLGTTAVFGFFVNALVRGPISLVDPMWACLYSLVSLLLGMGLIRERPRALALSGVAVYLAGAVLMGLSKHEPGSPLLAVWTLLVIVGATCNALMNYGYKTLSARLNVFWMLGSAYLVAGPGLAVYAVLTSPDSVSVLWTWPTPLLVPAMGLGASCVAVAMMTALRRGPLTLVDPMWACIYALGSVGIGMLMVQERPAPAALAGVGLYLVGVILMSRDRKAPAP